MTADEIAEGLRKCPFCAEMIRDEAKICRFCQRDLPVESKEADVTVTDYPPEPRPLRYGDRVSSPIMGDGTVANTPDGDTLRVRFDRDGVERTVAASDLEQGTVRTPTELSIPSSGPDDTLIVAAWATAFLLPFIGLICGVILAAKGKVGHGVGSMIVSLVMFFVWAALLGSFVA